MTLHQSRVHPLATRYCEQNDPASGMQHGTHFIDAMECTECKRLKKAGKVTSTRCTGKTCNACNTCKWCDLLIPKAVSEEEYQKAPVLNPDILKDFRV